MLILSALPTTRNWKEKLNLESKLCELISWHFKEVISIEKFCRQSLCFGYYFSKHTFQGSTGQWVISRIWDVTLQFFGVTSTKIVKLVDLRWKVTALGNLWNKFSLQIYKCVHFKNRNQKDKSVVWGSIFFTSGDFKNIFDLSVISLFSMQIVF